MVKKKEYIYICDKCHGEIIPCKGTIKCDYCGNIIVTKDNDWVNQSSKISLNKNNFVYRFFAKISNRTDLLSKKRKVFLTIFCILFFLILPIEIYDVIHGIGFFIGAIVSLFFIIHIGYRKYTFFKSTFFYLIVFVGLLFTYGYSYYYRRDLLFKENGRTAEAQIIDFTSSLSKSTRITYVHYRYQLNFKSYVGKENISKSEYFQLYDKQTILIDYIGYRPWISRINENSLVSNSELKEKK